MTWSLAQSVWPVLALLVFVMTKMMVWVLSSALYHEVRVHDRICKARDMRRQYFEDLGL